jgi:hypothetical protein
VKRAAKEITLLGLDCVVPFVLLVPVKHHHGPGILEGAVFFTLTLNANAQLLGS